MAVFRVVRIFVLTIFFNAILPTGDVYSDIILMFQTWTFQSTDSIEMIGCRTCFGRIESSLYPTEYECETCVINNFRFRGGGFFSPLNKLLEMENKNYCETGRWGGTNDNLRNGECESDNLYYFCFETRNNNSEIQNNDEEKIKSVQLHSRFLVDCDDYYVGKVSSNVFYDTCLLVGKAEGEYCSFFVVRLNDKEISKWLVENNKIFTRKNFTGIALKLLLRNNSSSDLSSIVPVEYDNLNNDESFECGVFIKPKNVNVIGDNKDEDCGLDTCKMHLDYLHYRVDGIHDLQSWQMDTHYYYGRIRVGGKKCHLFRVYAWTMVIPIVINLLFSGVVFYSDVKHGLSSKYEAPFLLLLLYPQWRTSKILFRYISHKNVEELENQLNKNDLEVSFIEPFCESGLQVSLLTSQELLLVNILILSKFYDLKVNFSFLILFRF